MKIPFRDERTGRGVKRVYWPRGDALEVRRDMRVRMESEIVRKDKKYSKADCVKALDERWGEFCERNPQIGDCER